MSDSKVDSITSSQSNRKSSDGSGIFNSLNYILFLCEFKKIEELEKFV